MALFFILRAWMCLKVDKVTDVFFLILTVMDSAVESTQTLNSAHFGGWEAHTRGIGSKLMLKMGYEYGKGKCTTWTTT